jgi:hypothetical protein
MSMSLLRLFALQARRGAMQLCQRVKEPTHVRDQGVGVDRELGQLDGCQNMLVHEMVHETPDQAGGAPRQPPAQRRDNQTQGKGVSQGEREGAMRGLMKGNVG